MERLNQKLLNRRRALEVIGALGAAGLFVACGGTTTGLDGGADLRTGVDSGTGADGAAADGGVCTVIPEETAGPYPDKTGMINNTAFFRKDITEGKTGLPLALSMTVVNTNAACAGVAGAVVQIWHCDAAGDYSEYTQPGYDGTGQTFLRGLQTADSVGKVQFTTIYPGWYAGRVTHIHVEVYVGDTLVKTTQLAFSDAVTTEVYGTGVYAAKGQNSMKTAADMVFSDGDEYELLTLVGDTTKGYAPAIPIGVAL